MIPKVNRPELQLVVSHTKPAENDPGSSQGGGVAYEKPPEQEGDETKEAAQQDPPPNELSSAVRAEQIGFGELIRIHHEKNPGPALRRKPGKQYQDRTADASSSKGLLLNKKAE